jgi:tetratricopeptide (TPR) repeat protein
MPSRDRTGDLRRRLTAARDLVQTYDLDAAAAAVAELEAAVAEAGDSAEEQWVRARVGLLRAILVQEQSSDTARSLAILDDVEELVDAHDLDDLRVPVIGQRGLCMLRAGVDDHVLATFLRADPWLSSATTEDRLLYLLNRGYVHLEQGDLVAAEEDLRRCQLEAEASGEVGVAFKARHNRGYLAYLRGDLPRALELMGQAVDGADDRDAEPEPLVAVDRARVLVEAGLVADAVDLLGNAVPRLAAAQRRQDEAEARLARARGALVAGDFDLARSEASRAAAIFAERGNPRWRRRAAFVVLAVAVEDLQARRRGASDGASVAGTSGEPGALLDEIEALVDDAVAAGDDSVARPATSMWAEAALALGRHDLAARVLAAAPSGDDPLSVRLRWYRARAELAMATGDGDVQSFVQRGLAEMSEQQGRLGSLDLRTAMAIHGRELAALGIGHALAVGDEVLVHAALERAHASSTRLAPVRSVIAGPDAALVARLRQVTERIEALDAAGDTTVAARLRAEADDLIATLRQREWQRGAASATDELVSLATLQAALRPTGATFVSYGQHAGEVVAVVLDGTDVDVRHFGDAAAVDRLVARLRSDLQALVVPGVPEPVRDVVAASTRATLARLDDLLVAPLDVADSLVVVPGGPIALVPWGLVPSRRGRPTTVVPCATRWVRLASSAPRGRGMAAFAGPMLERAEAEVASLAAVWPDVALHRGPEAATTAVARSIEEQAVVHLAVHGTHRAQSPLFSSIRLHDGPLFAHELGSEAGAALVVLSACEVGSTTMREGDEPLGFTAALLEAGVATVLASVARVGDDTAHDVMVRVHRELVAGASPAAALAVAVAAAWERGDVAPFICVGAGLAPLPTSAPSPTGGARSVA